MKRFLDIVLSAVSLLVFSWLLVVLFLLVRLFMGAPVFFRQERAGLHGRSFELVKFRTMRNEVSEHGAPLPDEQRLTPLGRLLRATSLDELPELWNVLKGDMSLVGPRPLLESYLPLYSAKQARRHEVRPGMTGWAQVRGRNGLSWEERFDLDVWYVDNQSFALDVKILFLTVWKVISREGITQDGHATMENFRGSR